MVVHRFYGVITIYWVGVRAWRDIQQGCDLPLGKRFELGPE